MNSTVLRHFEVNSLMLQANRALSGRLFYIVGRCEVAPRFETVSGGHGGVSSGHFQDVFASKRVYALSWFN